MKAHSLQPCNDFVDALAKFEQQGEDRNQPSLPSWKPLFHEQCEILTWAWWWFRGLRGELDVPYLQFGDHQQAAWKKDDYDTAQSRIPDIERRPVKISEGFSMDLRVATYNVMTLRDKATECGERGEDWKAALLRQQCRTMEVNAIGLQETRATADGYLHTEDYLRFISGHHQGHHGCELWLAQRTKIKKGDGQTVSFNQEECTVIHSDGRLLLVRCNLDGLMLNFYVAHAPHEGTDEQDKDVWWQKFTQLLQRYNSVGVSIILGDFNARLQGEDGVHVGDRICKETNNNGRRLHEVLCCFSLCAPSTFSQVHSGDDHTWTHPRGGKARLDYILIPRNAGCIPRWSWVEKDFQTSLTVRDHEAALLDLRIYKQDQITKRKKPNYDWEAMATETGQAQLKSIVSNMREPHWDCDIHQHWQSLQDQLHEGLEQYFPAPKGRRRIEIFSQQTQKFLAERKKVKQALDADHLDHLEVEMTHKAWSTRNTLAVVKRLYLLPEYATVMALLLCRETSTRLRQSIKQDKADFISAVVRKANQGGMVDLYRELRPLRIGGVQRRRGFPTMPGFQWEGEMANTAEESEAFWLRHCSNLEAGVQTNTVRLLQRARKHAFCRQSQEASMELSRIPSLTTLEGAFRHVKMRKSGGADYFRSDLCHLAATELAKKFHPILLKMCVQKEEPIQMKGGILIPAFKSGDPSKPADHRSLLLSSHIGKAIRRTVRQQITPYYEATAPQTHFSIRKGGCVSHASHTLRLFGEAATRKNQSVGILYVDVKSAYYRVVRQLTVGGGDNHDTIRRTLDFFELGDTSLQDLINELADTPECIHSGVDSHYEEILQELLSSTWFTSKRQDVLFESLAGSRPGDGLADVVFAYAFKRILRKVAANIREELMLEETDIKPSFDLSTIPEGDFELPRLIETVWADDLAIAYRHGDARQLVKDIKLITKNVIQETLKHGMAPNLRKGKTEIQLMLKGNNSKMMKAELYNIDEPCLNIEEVPADFGQVYLVAQYKHLGTRIDVSLKHRREIQARMGQAHAVFKKYRRQLFQNKLLGREKRLYIFKSLVMSVLEYNIGTWGALLKSEEKLFNSKLMALYRGVARGEVPEEELRLWSHDRVRAFLKLLSATELLHGARMRYSISLYKSAPHILWHLIACEGRWLQQLHSAHEWLGAQLFGYGPDQDGHEWKADPHGWCVNGTANYRGWIKAATEHAIWQHTILSDWREWHHDFLQTGMRQGLQIEIPIPQGADIQGRQEAEARLCCSQAFAGRAAWAVHAFKRHDRIAEARRVVDGTRCANCSREYFTPVRLQHHLRYSRKCYRKLLRNGRWNPEVMPGQNRTRTPKDPSLRIPVLPSLGPQEQAMAEEIEPEEPIYEWDTMEAWIDALEALPAHSSVEDCVEAIKEACRQSTASFGDIKKTLDFFATNAAEEQNAMNWVVPQAVVGQAARVAWRRFRLEWFFNEEQLKEVAPDAAFRNAAWQFCLGNQTRPKWDHKPYIPRFGSKVMAFLHLFSGERRTGDLHTALENLKAPAGCVLVVISVDIIFACGASQKKWVEFMLAGCIAGIFAGPPCETWSRSRARGGIPGFSRGDGGPRTLRHIDQPQGLGQLKVKEAKQLAVANRLLCFSLTLMLCAIQVHRLMVLEHPEEPDQEDQRWIASIWRLFVTVAIECNPHVHRSAIYQGFYGGLSPKPTSLMVCCGPKVKVEEILFAARTQQYLPASLSMGWRKEKREYATASLKTYPAGLCNGLAMLAQSWMDNYGGVVEDFHVPMERFVAWTSELQRNFNLSVVRGADYHTSTTAC